MKERPESIELDPFDDLPRILEEMRQAVREALLRHKRLGYPVAIWRDDQVVWIAPEDIPVD